MEVCHYCNGKKKKCDSCFGLFLIDPDTFLKSFYEACKQGNWDKVFSMISGSYRTSHIIDYDYVSPSSGYTPLHQAYWNNVPVIQSLLWDCFVDPLVQNHAGQTPLDLAISRGCLDAAEILKKWNASYLVDRNSRFCSSEATPASFIELSKFIEVEQGMGGETALCDWGKWKRVARFLMKHIYPIAPKSKKKGTHPSDLVEVFIKGYTSNAFYAQMNLFLRFIEPTEESILSFMGYEFYNASLHLSAALERCCKPFEGIAYRKFNLTGDEIDQYYPGLKFVWPSFTSSSKSETVASNWNGNVFVEIEVSLGLNQGYEVSSFSMFPQEKEVLFPANTAFVVKSVILGMNNNYIRIANLSCGLNED